MILADEKSDTKEMRALLKKFADQDIRFVTTQTLATALGNGVARVATIEEMADMITNGKVAFVISLNTNLNKMKKDLYRLRRKAVELQVPFLTTLEEGEAILMCVQTPLKSLT